MVLQVFNRNYENVFLCGITLVLLPDAQLCTAGISCGTAADSEIIILLFIFSAEILGEIGEFYIKIPGWDTMLHTMNGLLAAAVGFFHDRSAQSEASGIPFSCRLCF